MNRGLFKKAAAVMLSMIMAFGTVSVLPDSAVKDNAIIASAYRDLTGLSSYSINGCTFYYKVIEKGKVKSVSIEDVDIENDEFKVEIPSEINSYTVTDIGWHFLKGNKEVKTFIMPNTIVNTGAEILWDSSVEEVVISDNLEELGWGFCYKAPNLKRENVKYNGNKLKDVKPYCFYDCPDMIDANGVICLKNWLIRYAPEKETTRIKLANLGNDGVRVDSIADGAINAEKLESVDLQYIKYIGDDNFANYSQLTTVSNADDVMSLGKNSLKGTPWYDTWYDNGKKNGLLKFGRLLYYYKTDSNVIDLTSGDLAGMVYVAAGSFVDCKNVDTIKLNSDCKLSTGCFYEAHDNSDKRLDPLPSTPSYNIKNIYLDGKKLEFNKDDPMMCDWFDENYYALEKTQWLKDVVEDKTKALFEQLDITYYGLENDKAGTLTPTEEFYIMLKIHEYISTFGVNLDYSKAILVFMYSGKTQCNGYATLTSYLLQCAGVTNVLNHSVPKGQHVWNHIKIGDEWFECDMGWDEQGGHNYHWFTLSDDIMIKRAVDADSEAHIRENSSCTWYSSSKGDYKDYVPAARTLGDLDGNHVRDETDTQMLWDYLSGKIILAGEDVFAADINFDGHIDVTDAVLLQNFVNGTAVDPENYPTDGLAPGFKVVYANKFDYNYNDYTYLTTDRDGYIVLAEPMFEAPEGKKFGGWDYGQSSKRAGQPGRRVKISNPYTVIQPIWKNLSEPDDEWLLGDVDGDNVIDIKDVSMIINHINGVKALSDDDLLCADVNKSNSVDISDASAIVNHINGVKAINGKV